MGSKNVMRSIARVGSLGVAISAASMMIGCSGFESPEMFSTALLSVSESNQIAQENTPACVLSYADFQLDENLIDFEVTSTTGVDFGFNFNSSWISKIGLNVQASKVQMQMTMDLAQSTDPTSTVANANGTATVTNSSVGINLDFLLFSAGVSNSSTTPLTTLISKAIGNGLGNLNTSLTKVAPAWSSPIVYLLANNQMIIPAGSIAGLRLGDQFQVFNIDYIWAGDPCNSQLLIPQKTTTAPVALVQVVQLEENAALLQVYDQMDTNESDRIILGSRVFVENLPLAKGEKSRSLLHSVKLRNVVSEPLALANGTNVDLTKYLTTETSTILQSYGLYPR